LVELDCPDVGVWAGGPCKELFVSLWSRGQKQKGEYHLWSKSALLSRLVSLRFRPPDCPNLYIGGLAVEELGRSLGSLVDLVGSMLPSCAPGKKDCLRFFFFFPPRWFRLFLPDASPPAKMSVVDCVFNNASVGR
jgi:hypothetical protein